MSIARFVYEIHQSFRFIQMYTVYCLPNSSNQKLLPTNYVSGLQRRTPCIILTAVCYKIRRMCIFYFLVITIKKPSHVLVVNFCFRFFCTVTIIRHCYRIWTPNAYQLNSVVSWTSRRTTAMIYGIYCATTKITTKVCIFLYICSTLNK